MLLVIGKGSCPNGSTSLLFIFPLSFFLLNCHLLPMVSNVLFLVKNKLYWTGNLILLLFINIVLKNPPILVGSSSVGFQCDALLGSFSPMGTVLRQTYPGFLWTQKWKSINNLNFFKGEFSSLMNIQAWLQLNSKDWI